MTTSALSRQEGGTHYRGMKIQPIEFGMRNQWDFGACSILKYLSRHRSKNGLEDLRKARHFIELRLEFLGSTRLPQREILMIQFLVENRIHEDDYTALLALEAWVQQIVTPLPLMGAIDSLLRGS